MLPEEQIEHIKKQLIQQIESNFPEDKKAQAISQIESMDGEQLEQFLIQNNLIKTGQDIAHGSQISKESQCIFCSIVDGSIQSYKVDENKKAIAILEINPISKGHTIIVPKEHISDTKKLSKDILSFAGKVAKKIKTKLKSKEIEISPQKIFEHAIINVLPVYKDETMNSERHQTKPEELLELQNLFEKKSKPKIIKKQQTERIKESEKLWLPKRIP